MFRWYAAREAGGGFECPAECRVNEWELPLFDPFQGINNFGHASALWHVAGNAGLHADMVGFVRHGMKLPRQGLLDFMNVGSPTKVAYLKLAPAEYIAGDTPLPLTFWQAAAVRAMARQDPQGQDAQDAQEKHDKWQDLVRGRPVPSALSFILPQHALLELVRFATDLMPHVIRSLAYDTTHLAAVLERVAALWIAAAVHTGRLGPAVHICGCEEQELDSSGQQAGQAAGQAGQEPLGAPAAPAALHVLVLGPGACAVADRFPGATVCGIDLGAHPASAPRVHLVQHDATDPAVLEVLPVADFDLIIDDASHDPAHQLDALALFAPLLRPGGAYVLERIADIYADHVRKGVEAVAARYNLRLDWKDSCPQVSCPQVSPVSRDFDRITATLYSPTANSMSSGGPGTAGS